MPSHPKHTLVIGFIVSALVLACLTLSSAVLASNSAAPAYQLQPRQTRAADRPANTGALQDQAQVRATEIALTAQALQGQGQARATDVAVTVDARQDQAQARATDVSVTVDARQAEAQARATDIGVTLAARQDQAQLRATEIAVTFAARQDQAQLRATEINVTAQARATEVYATVQYVSTQLPAQVDVIQATAAAAIAQLQADIANLSEDAPLLAAAMAAEGSVTYDPATNTLTGDRVVTEATTNLYADTAAQSQGIDPNSVYVNYVTGASIVSFTDAGSGATVALTYTVEVSGGTVTPVLVSATINGVSVPTSSVPSAWESASFEAFYSAILSATSDLPVDAEVLVDEVTFTEDSAYVRYRVAVAEAS
jgi:hypothetical protein